MTQDIDLDAISKEIASKIRLTRVANLEQEHFTEPEQIACKWCGSKDIMKYGIREGVQEYICKKCRRKFTNRDMPYGKRSTVEDIGTSISSYYDGLSFADEIAREKKISRSKVIALFLQELAEKRRDEEMAEGYLAMAKENKKFADLSARIEHEVIPEWKQTKHGH